MFLLKYDEEDKKMQIIWKTEELYRKCMIPIHVDLILTSWLKISKTGLSNLLVSSSLKTLQGTSPTVMLMLCQRCHDVRTTCITKLICVLGNVVYITWRRIFVNMVTTWAVGAHQGVMGPHQLRLGSIFIDIPVKKKKNPIPVNN